MASASSSGGGLFGWAEDSSGERADDAGGATVSEKKNKRSREDVMEFHTVIGLVWDDEEQMYFVNTWKDGTEKPKSMKEVTHYAYTTNIG